MSDFVDSIVKHEDREFRAPKAPIEETFDEVRTVAKGGAIETYSDKASRERQLPQSARDLIARMEAEGDDEPGETDEDAAPGGEVAADLVADKPGGDPAKPAETPAAKPAETPAAVAGIDPAEHERVLAANKQLLADLEAERGKSKPARALPKHLDGLDNAYIEDELGAVRRLIASALDIEDPKDARVDDELRALYTTLTATTLGVTPDEAHVAKRESARTRLMLERDKKERKATEQTSAEQVKAQAEAEQAKKAAEYIGAKLSVKVGDAKSIADEYPLLMALAETFDGMTPDKLLFETLKRETKTGRLKITGNDDNDLRDAAKLIETHYQALVDKVGKARPTPSPTPSTATPNGDKPSAATPSTSNDTRQTTGARTLTNADASAAPAAPPAPKQKPKSDERPRFKSKKEEQDWALRHLRTK